MNGFHVCPKGHFDDRSFRSSSRISRWPQIGVKSLLSRILILFACLVNLGHAVTEIPAAAADEPNDDGHAEHVTAAATPDPSLSPEEVVRIQLRALQYNDTDDSGIRTTYGFASPANKQVTGPYERFAQMIKAAPYRAMLNAASLALDEIRVEEKHAVQRVRVVTSDGQKNTYVFVVRRQDRPPYQDCWMTDAVFSLPNVHDEDYKRGPPGFG